MKKKDRIKELERRVALLEAEVAGLRGQQRIVWTAPAPGTAPNLPPNPWANPTITCTVKEIDGKALTAAIRNEARTRGRVGIN